MLCTKIFLAALFIVKKTETDCSSNTEWTKITVVFPFKGVQKCDEKKK